MHRHNKTTSSRVTLNNLHEKTDKFSDNVDKRSVGSLSVRTETKNTLVGTTYVGKRCFPKPPPPECL